MSNLNVFNPPSFAAIQATSENMGEPERLQITPLVRTAVRHSLHDEARYAELCKAFAGGAKTGSAHADMYFFAADLVERERGEGRAALSVALDANVINLADIVKRVGPELKKAGLDVHRGVLRGLLRHDLSESQA